MLIEPVKDFRLVSCMFWYVDMYQWLMSRHMNVSLRPDAEERGRPTGQNASKTTIGWSIFFIYVAHLNNQLLPPIYFLLANSFISLLRLWFRHTHSRFRFEY